MRLNQNFLCASKCPIFAHIFSQQGPNTTVQKLSLFILDVQKILSRQNQSHRFLSIRRFFFRGEEPVRESGVKGLDPFDPPPKALVDTFLPPFSNIVIVEAWTLLFVGLTQRPQQSIFLRRSKRLEVIHPDPPARPRARDRQRKCEWRLVHFYI